MLCKLTQVYFEFKSGLKEGIHPECFSYSLSSIQRKIKWLLRRQSRITERDQIYSRLGVLLYLDERLGLPIGSVTYRGRQGDSPPVFNPEEFIKELFSTLNIIDDTTVLPRKLKLKSIPCKGTVEFLHGVFFTYQEGMKYSYFKQYLQTTLLSDAAINALVEYDHSPTKVNFRRVQLCLTGQEHMLLGSALETDYYSNKKVQAIKRKLDSNEITLPEEIKDVPTNSHKTKRDLRCTNFKIEVKIKTEDSFR